MSLLKFLIPLGLGIAGLVAFTNNASAAPKDTKPMPDALVQKISAALDSADPTTIRKVAAQAKAAGFPQTAAQMNEAADDIEKAIKKTQIVNPEAKTGATSPLPTATPAGAPVVSPTQDADRVFAGKVALMLHNSRKGSENKEMVRAFQQLEHRRGFAEVGIPDGLYGVKTGLALAKDHGIVPPKPFYFPKNPTPSKNLWRSELSKLAAKDPARAEEWSRAANNI